MKKEFDIYGEESGYIKSFETLKEAQEYIKELKQFDKRIGIEDTYYIEETENSKMNLIVIIKK